MIVQSEEVKMTKCGKPNIRQVAAHAGVSPATVSRVLNGNAAVDAALAQRVPDQQSR